MNKNIRNALILTGVTLTGLYVANRIINTIAESKLHSPRMERKSINWRYGEISYIKSGEGSPVILIHNLDPLSSSYEWEKVIEQLSKEYCVYAIDLLGCGNSDKPNMTYTNYMYVQLLNDFIKTVIGEKTSVVAHKNSVSFAVMACNMNPELYDKLILVNPTNPDDFYKMPSKNKNALKYVLDSPIVGTFIYNMMNTKGSIETKLEKQIYRNSKVSREKLTDEYFSNAHTSDSHGKYLNSSIMSHYTNINIDLALKKINNSISIISGEEDPSANFIVDKYKTLNPSIEASMIKEASSLPHLENTKEFIDNLKIYLN